MNGIETLDNAYLKPQLNMVQDVPTDGIDLIINKKKKSLKSYFSNLATLCCFQTNILGCFLE